jgi:hypothetical protein
LRLDLCPAPRLRQRPHACLAHQRRLRRSQFNEWVKENVKSATWSGACKDAFTDGEGTLVLSLRTGELRYVGAMSGGFIRGKGEYTRETGWRRVGDFSFGRLKQGKVYRPDGKLVFDGTFLEERVTCNDGGRITTSVYDAYDRGTLHLNDANGTHIVDGRFDGRAGPHKSLADVDPDTGRGFVCGVVKRGDAVVARFVDGQRFDDTESYQHGIAALGRREGAARQDANANAANAAAAADAREREQREREARAATANLQATANLYAQQRQGGVAATPPPVASPTLPAAPPPPAARGDAAGLAQWCRTEIGRIHEEVARQMRSARNAQEADRIAVAVQAVPQKNLFEGPCRDHPQAAAYIRTANTIIANAHRNSGAGGGPASQGTAGGVPTPTQAGAATPGRSAKRGHVPEAIAHQCLQVQPQGGVRNSCGFAVEYSYCVLNPRPNSNSAAFDCARTRGGSWQVGAGSTAIMHTAGDHVYFFACRYGSTISKPDGISPAGVHHVPGQGLQGRCAEWGAG